jgi:GNAT superfamily N-acetyltransferase
MRLADVRPGWHTDFVLHRFGAQVLERDDCLVVRTPSNPGFYWGNFLLLPQPPANEEVHHWLARFHEEIAAVQPGSRHVAIGVNAPADAVARPAWAAAGFETHVTTLMMLAPGGLQPPSPPRGECLLRPLDLATEGEALIDLEATDADGFEPSGYRAYLRLQHRRYQAMQAAGLLTWFGLRCEGRLAASCGLLRDAAGPGAMARFQRVVTHPAMRRRGLASAMVAGVACHAFDAWGARAVAMVADPADVAITLYRRLGWREAGTAMDLERRAPEDGGPPADSTTARRAAPAADAPPAPTA